MKYMLRLVFFNNNTVIVLHKDYTFDEVVIFYRKHAKEIIQVEHNPMGDYTNVFFRFDHYGLICKETTQ